MSTDSLVLTGSARAKDVPSSRAAAVTADVADVPAYGSGKWLMGSRVELAELPRWQQPFGWLWLRVVGGPPTFPTVRGTFTTRERGRAHCTTRRDWLMWIPNDAPMGAAPESPRFYNEPLNDAETDRRHAELFAFEETAAREAGNFLLAWRDELKAAAARAPSEGR